MVPTTQLHDIVLSALLPDQKTGRPDPLSLQRKISKLMVAAHGISFELASYHVARMDEAELLFRFCQYAGWGCRWRSPSENRPNRDS